MRHFNHIEWKAYKDKILNRGKEIEMEEHLYTCDHCMEIFLSTIDKVEIQEAKAYIPQDFNENLMKTIEKLKPISKPRKKKPRLINDFFLYYAAVASVAIVLTAGGIFGSLVDSVPKISINVENKERKIKTDTVFNISESITNKTSDFINNFGINKVKED